MSAAVKTAKMLDVPTRVAILVQPLNLQHFIHRCSTLGDLRQPFVQQPIQAFLLVTVDVTAKRPLMHPQQSGCFLLGQTPLAPSKKRLLKSHYPGLL
jgi:hypothetical protein